MYMIQWRGTQHIHPAVVSTVDNDIRMGDANIVPEDEDADIDFDHGGCSREEDRCPSCNEICPRKILILCARCGKNYHITCVKVSKKLLKEIPLFTCPPCRDVVPSNHEPTEAGSQPNPNFDLCQHLATCRANISLLGISLGVQDYQRQRP